MHLSTLALRATTYYRKTNIAVVLGVACAVAVLAGALVVGESVRASLRELSLARLGRAETAIVSDHFFREALAADLTGVVPAIAPIVLLDAVVSDERTGQRASRVQVAGVDDRFWSFHGVEAPKMGSSDAWLSPGLEKELGFADGDTVLVRTRMPSDIPAEFLHGRRDDVGRTIRLRGAGVLPRDRVGEFSLRPQQGDVRTIFVRLQRLQRDLRLGARANILLLRGGERASGGSEDIRKALRERATADDLSLRVRALPRGDIAIESQKGLLDAATSRAVLEAARAQGLQARPMFTYVVNAVRLGDRMVPYSLVTGVDAEGVAVNEWTARELRASPGDRLVLEYYVWSDAGRLETRTADVTIDTVVPTETADADFAPAYPGISDTRSLADWDPPFPIDLSRVRPQDEEYWRRYRTTPKVLLPLAAAQALWGTRWGNITSIRLSGDAGALSRLPSRLNAALAAEASGLTVVPVRQEALRASTGATDFGAYFTYFSFFITAAALLLAATFFRLGLEQRLQQIGVLRAIGYAPQKLRTLFLLEGGALALVGSMIGVIGALAYAWIIMLGLRTWWVGAVGTTNLELHPSLSAIGAGVAGGWLAAILAIVYTLWALRRATPRALLSGDVSAAFRARLSERRSVGANRLAAWLAVAAVALSALAFIGVLSELAGFFGAGILLLAATLAAFSGRLAARSRPTLAAVNGRGVARLGLRYASWRRGRSVVSAALIASAVFLIVSVEAFRRDVGDRPNARVSSTGGAALIAESLLPIVHHPDAEDGRQALNLTTDSSSGALPTFRTTPFRLSDGDDASCVNLYRPQRPRLIGAPEDFIDAGRFAFAKSVATGAEERANPWLLLRRRENDHVIPAIVDATSLQYVLHLGVGDEMDSGRVDANGRRIRLRIVASLSDSVLQSEIIIADSRFRAAFPDVEGYRFFLIDVDGDEAAAARVARFVEERLEDFGFDATGAAARLASFHRVENTYLSTFQALGVLGLLLGTFGLGAVAVRNVLERRRELALLRAVGYRRRDLVTLVVAENALLLAVGVGAGVVASLVAVLPALIERGERPSAASLLGLIAAVVIVGLGASGFAARSSTRAPLLPALRAE